ncbi:Profilin/allergen [Xylariaceae sp. AK1471]|nr:Profilin/allergen [Xylariaceae sp. AK1471]
MSWQQYIDSSLVGSGHIDKAAIVSAAGDSVWATSAGFNIQAAELKNIVNILAAAENEKGDQSAVAKAQAEGIHVAGERYVVARIDGRSIYARSVGGTSSPWSPSNQNIGRTGICIAKTKQAFIAAHHGEAHVAGNASSTTEALADYLIKSGY